MKLPLYIHIPFCRKKCAYCDFYSIGYNRKLATRFIELLSFQIKALRSEGFSFASVYFGGGTPSILDENILESLLKAIDLKDAKEVTFEANPESLTRRKLELLLRSGVDRLSMGLQSFDDQVLRFLGRAHRKKEALKGLDLAKRAGFKNISIDLIYAVPSRGWQAFKHDLAKAVSLPINHISIYSLTYEKHTPLFARLKAKEFLPLSEEEDAKAYRNSIDFLEDHGFLQYEVSSFAKPGFRCKHNLYYWENSPYLGLGPSSVSYIGGVRKKYTPDIHRYIKEAGGESQDHLIIEEERLTPLRRAKETAALNIRRKQGINFKGFKANTGFDFRDIEGQAMEQLKSERLIIFKKSGSKIYGLKLTRKGFLFCDRVCSEFL